MLDPSTAPSITAPEAYPPTAVTMASLLVGTVLREIGRLTADLDAPALTALRAAIVRETEAAFLRGLRDVACDADSADHNRQVAWLAMRHPSYREEALTIVRGFACDCLAELIARRGGGA